MAYGKPVVAADFGGIPDFVVDGVTGFLVPVGDVPKLVSALKILLDDPSRQRWLRDIQYARKGYYSASAQVHPRPYIGSLSSSTANSFFIGVQAGLAMLRMDSTSMYVNLR